MNKIKILNPTLIFKRDTHLIDKLCPVSDAANPVNSATLHWAVIMAYIMYIESVK